MLSWSFAQERDYSQSLSWAEDHDGRITGAHGRIINSHAIFFMVYEQQGLKMGLYVLWLLDLEGKIGVQNDDMSDELLPKDNFGMQKTLLECGERNEFCKTREN